MDLSVSYLGLKLKSPVVVGSSSLTASVRNLKKIEASGAGAVVLKSIFEEEIYNEYSSILEKEKKEETPDYGYLDYYDYKIKDDNVKKYLELIKTAKEAVNIPVIASCNCVSSWEWCFFAKKIEEAGADAIELNMFALPSDFTKTCTEIEDSYLKRIESIKKAVKIPVSVKLSYYFADLAAFVKKVSGMVDGVVLFNRFFHPDFDIDKFEVVPSNVLSQSSDLAISLRWMSIMAGRIDSDLIASTGVHDGASVIKEILAGANAVQVVSSLYKNGIESIATMLEDVKAWMEKHGFTTLDDFRGKMSQENSPNPAEYERVQFMRYFESKKYDLD
ncbi:MAG: dihydroorotate dehydrogenase-like protein [Bacteroidales bacterium]|nr:dihydroorotate dehydrogenase-like protein [Bacteroidales bacterium]